MSGAPAALACTPSAESPDFHRPLGVATAVVRSSTPTWSAFAYSDSRVLASRTVAGAGLNDHHALRCGGFIQFPGRTVADSSGWEATRPTAGQAECQPRRSCQRCHLNDPALAVRSEQSRLQEDRAHRYVCSVRVSSTERQVVDTLSAVLCGTLASVNHDNERATRPEPGQPAPIEGLAGMSAQYGRYATRELRRRRLQVLTHIGLSMLSAVAAVVVVMALGRF
jgi:hypothetical protein